DEEAAAIARAEMARAMLLEIEQAVRCTEPDGGISRFQRECAAFLISAGVLGMCGDASPAMHVLMALDRVEPDSQRGVFERWPDFEEAEGFDALCVCSWALYWFDQWEGDSLE